VEFLPWKMQEFSPFIRVVFVQLHIRHGLLYFISTANQICSPGFSDAVPLGLLVAGRLIS